MKFKISLWFGLLGLLLAACGGAAETPATATSGALETDLDTEPTAFQSPPATCSAVGGLVLGEEDSLFPEVSSSDWVRGPADATVTFVEYGDFQ